MIVPDSLNGPSDATQWTLGLSDLTHQPSLRTLQETIEQFPFDHGAENGDIVRGVRLTLVYDRFFLISRCTRRAHAAI